MKKVLSTILLATLVLSVVAVAGVVPVRAAVVGTLEVSSSQFSGNSIIYVRLYDPDLNVNSAGYDTPLITYKKGTNSTTIMLNETLPNSGEFYAFLRASGSTVTPQNPPYGTNYPVYDLTLSPGDTFTLSYADQSPVGTVSVTVTYDTYSASAADISFDRSSLEYPMNGYIRVSVKDLDWNLDPTYADNVTLNWAFFDPVTSTTYWLNATATETDVNSAVFRIETSYFTDATNFGGYTFNLVGISSGSAIKVSYANESTPPFKYITFKTFPRSLNVATSFTTNGDLLITVVDPNFDHKSWSKDNLGFGGTNVTISTNVGGDTVTLTTALVETDVASGTFTKKVPVVIGTATADSTLQIEVGDSKAKIKYYANGTLRAETISTLSTTPATITSDKTQYKVGGTVKLTITAPDLNDDPDNINFFTCTLPNNNATISSINVNQNLQTVGKLTIKVNGLLATTDSGQNLVFVESGPNTGIFTASLSLAKIYNNANGSLVNGDSILVSYADQLNDVTSSVSFTIGVAAASISLDRSTYPVPRDGNVQIRVTVTDSEANTDSNTIQQSIAYVDVYYYNGTLESSNSFTVTETGPNTGVFTGFYTLPSSLLAAYINGWVKALYVDPSTGKNITATATLVATDAAISVDMTTVKAGDKFTITVTDPDNNLDSKFTQSVNVYYEYTDNTGTKQTGTWTLTETDVNTGKFTISKTVGSDIKLQPGSTMKFTYRDNSPSYITASAGYPSSPVEYTATVKVASYTGTLSIDKNEYGLGSKMVITVDDPDLNTDITTAQSTQVTLRVSGYADQTLTLDEDGASSSVFSTTYTWSSTNTDLIGKTFQIYYKDSVDANGNTVYAVVTGTVKSWDAEVSFDKAYYNIGDIATITVKDPDLNKNPSQIETSTVTVTSDSDPVGQTITVTETGVNTGVFTGKIQISSAFATGKVYAKVGDTIKAEYKDNLPADFASTGKAKTFSGTAIVGVPVERPVPASAQKFVDPNTGVEKTTGAVGQAIGLQATVKNVDVVSKTFTAIFKVKDSAGVTIFISWVTGTLTPGQELTPGVSWTPSAAGEYTVEVLVVKTLSEPTPYSDIQTKTLTVA
ncbi:MAG: hypothetical protein QXP73_06715 [Candidatus Methanomethylicaceae archaeon]